MWRRKGDGKERRHVAVEEEGERERASLRLSPRGRSSPRERDVEKGGKT